MTTHFSRTLGLLRKERKISQREAAGELDVSQALLSHYENGQREPGLSFVAKAADYYNVSCDYLLGRSMSKDGSAIAADQIIDITEQKDNVLKGSVAAMLHKKLVVNSAALLMDLAGATGSRNLSMALSSYFSFSFYRAFRYLYSAIQDEKGSERAFSIDLEEFDALCDSQQKLWELKIKAAAAGGGRFGMKQEEIKKIGLKPEDISGKYPGVSQSLLSVLQTVSDSLTKNIKNI